MGIERNIPRDNRFYIFKEMKFSSMIAQVSILARGEVISRERRNTREIGPEVVGRYSQLTDMFYRLNPLFDERELCECDAMFATKHNKNTDSYQDKYHTFYSSQNGGAAWDARENCPRGGGAQRSTYQPQCCTNRIAFISVTV